MNKIEVEIHDGIDPDIAIDLFNKAYKYVEDNMVVQPFYFSINNKDQYLVIYKKQKTKMLLLIKKQ